jgi:hypothetical protein
MGLCPHMPVPQSIVASGRICGFRQSCCRHDRRATCRKTCLLMPRVVRMCSLPWLPSLGLGIGTQCRLACPEVERDCPSASHRPGCPLRKGLIQGRSLSYTMAKVGLYSGENQGLARVVEASDHAEDLGPEAGGLCVPALLTAASSAGGLRFPGGTTRITRQARTP